MTIQAYQNSGSGLTPVPNFPILSPRDPTTTDKVSPNGNPYQLLQGWKNTTTNSVFEYLGGGVWVEVSQGGSGPITSLTGDSGTATPSSGNIQIAGTANEITTLASGSTVTVSLPVAITAPGSLTTTTSLSSTTTITAGTGITSTTGNIVATAGAVNAGTSITATLGNITATNGNIVRGTAGNKDIYTSVASTTTAGANSAGTVTLAGGTATVSTTAVTASSIIRLYRQGIGSTGAAALGILTLGTITASTSFVINSVQAADATALQASDVSVIGWEIVN